jgi:hypothetical protein
MAFFCVRIYEFNQLDVSERVIGLDETIDWILILTSWFSRFLRISGVVDTPSAVDVCANFIYLCRRV